MMLLEECSRSTSRRRDGVRPAILAILVSSVGELAGLYRGFSPKCIIVASEVARTKGGEQAEAADHCGDG